MALRAAALLVLSLLHVCSPGPVRRPVGWFEQCRSSTNLSITALEVLPGGGWDNLRNIEMGRVMDFSYAQCQTTEDGFYFVPDDVFVIARKVTNVDTYAEVISSWLHHKSSTSYSMNIAASGSSAYFGELHGKFSAEHQRAKTNQINGKSSTARVQIRNHIYTVKADPDFTLDSRFVQQVLDIADAIINNQTRLASYLSEKLVADYGTHVITSVDAGANLVKEDYFKSASFTDSVEDMTSVKASAGYNYFSLFAIDAEMGYKHESSEQSKYDGSITSSFMEGHGGAPFYPGMCLAKWQESTRNNLVAIDRSGLPLYYVINTNTLPDLSQQTVRKVSDSLQQAIEHYYKVNTHRGCLNVDSTNFDYQANVDSEICNSDSKADVLYLGGVFQKCEGASQLCQKLDQINIYTGDYSCRPPFQQRLLNTEEREEPYTVKVLITETYSCWIFICTRQVWRDVVHVRSAKVHTYWCYNIQYGPTKPKAIVFGGVYGNTFVNLIGRGKSCPNPLFTAIKFLSNDIMICLSNKYEEAVPFLGFYSCNSNHPLTEDRRCPPHLGRYLITVIDGCPIYFCSYLRDKQPFISVFLPPFTRPPVVGVQSNSVTVRVLTEGKQSWVKVGQSKSWTRVATDHVQDVIENSVTDSADDPWEKAGIGLGVIALVILMIVGVVLTVRWKKGLPLCKKQSHGEDAYSQAKVPGPEKQVEHEMEQPC